MSRLSFLTTTMGAIAVIGVLHMPGGMNIAAADDDSGVVRIVSHAKSALAAPGLIPQTSEAKPIQSISSTRTIEATPIAKHHNSHPTRLGPVQSVPGNCYPQINAPLYPAPQPNTPTYVGGTAITNQAFAPHEMLYPHQYKALYGPYYYKVRGHWFLTPKGVRSHDTWELQGTEVSVKYRSHYRPFSFYFPPATRW